MANFEAFLQTINFTTHPEFLKSGTFFLLGRYILLALPSLQAFTEIGGSSWFSELNDRSELTPKKELLDRCFFKECNPKAKDFSFSNFSLG